MKFTSLNLSKETLKALKDLSFKDMTPIQEQAIPLLLKKRDLIGQADTGTGKTAAFAIPIIESLDPQSNDVQALILCPTRELCCQVAEQCNELMKYHEDFSSLAIYGGQNIETQIKALANNPQLIVATPGRALDHLRRGSLKLHALQSIVLDEADKMLEMGFLDDVESILAKNKNKKAHIMLFSATMQAEVLKLAKNYQNKAQHINLKKRDDKQLKIEQFSYTVREDLKIETIKRLLFFHQVKSAMIFCNTRLQVDKVYNKLKKDGFSIAKLHGELKQNMRDSVMNKFRNAEVRILIATDIAARGIDVDDIDTVFNYNLPRDSEDFVHRIGRTARAGKSGLAISLVTSKEIRDLNRIIARHKFTIKEKSIPSIEALGLDSVISLQSTLMDSTLNKNTSKKQLKFIKELEKNHSEDQIIVDKFFTHLKQSNNNLFGVNI